MNTVLQLSERLSEQLTDVATAAPDQLGVTVEELRRRGARRRQTRIGVASAAVLLVAGATAGGVLSGVGSAGSGPEGATVGAPPATAGPSAGGRSAGTSTDASTATSADAGSEYAVVEPVTTIATGEATAGGELTLWFAVHDDRFLQAVGQRGPDGRLALIGVTNDPDVAGTGPGDVGFHAGWEVGSGQDRFITGYVVGDVTKVALTVDGTPMTARSAAWSENPAVHVWWLRVPAPAGTNGQPAQVRDLTAFDAAGGVVAAEPDGAVGVG
ncbi:hypothetical protein AB0K00_23340 [Dactylosporangium sp. NPDC049525]|uniref:hypothetical protein n=1 Tax=Dactylosporangium sp. NPDC049525 TaxID=3154730 RepID=UPI0034335EE7